MGRIRYFAGSKVESYRTKNYPDPMRSHRQFPPFIGYRPSNRGVKLLFDIFLLENTPLNERNRKR